MAGLRSSFLTASLAILFVMLFAYFMSGRTIKFSSWILYRSVIVFTITFIPLTVLSLILPLFGKKHWNTLNNNAIGNDIIDN